jgi:magnesium and cobalt transporter
MGDTQDGSSSAAQGAPQNVDDTGANGAGTTPGLFTRVMSAFSGNGPAANGQPLNGAEHAALGAAAPSLLNLSKMRVEDVMIPRAEIVAVADDMAKDELVEIFRQSGLTRLPVYQGTLDTPIGMVHLKDLALSHGFNGNGGAFDLKGMLRRLLFAPPSMPIGTLLQKMQTDRVHMALVIDEYGGVDGLVTIEDLIEQVIGEIEDEHDVAEGRFWTVEKPGCYLAQAKTPLDEFEAELGQKLTEDADDEEIGTLGGLVFRLAGRVPARGEVIPHPLDLDFEVVDADPRRIKRLRVRVGGAPSG